MQFADYSQKRSLTRKLLSFAQRRYTIYSAFAVFVLSAAVAGALPATVPTATPRLDLSGSVCVDLADTLEPPRAWIPVGCETRLCCPGCPDGAIDWHIRVSGDPLESTLLQFDNLSPAAARKLRIKGNARWEGNALRVMPGETIVSGFKHDPRATPVIATPRLFASRDRLANLQHAAGADATRPLGRMEVFVEQMMGKYAISEARVAYNVKRCSNGPNSGDRILLNNNIGTDNSIVLIDARTGSGACLDDQEFRGAGVVNVGDLRPFDVCTSDTSVFSDDNGMYFVNPTIWTDSPVDEQILNLPQMFRAPVAVWIAINESGAQERAERDMANANYLYNTNKVGFAFDATYASALQLADIAREACANAGRIKASNFYQPGRINVYYIDNWLVGWHGFACWNDEANRPAAPGMIFINRWAHPETLAHEFGHTFSLCDIRPDECNIAGIGSDNIMAPRGMNDRYNFTLGQAFRMNVNSTSVINVNGVRVGWGMRDCPDGTTTNRCPALTLDVTPK